ncbi:hypothetical protein GCM10010994_28700 [Chelatococcus reniformis]|uniref:Uncharacterized protein n=1 Tax=Chelatococcus reniformis TaxID=1494448 RepID=A0A916UDL3_9HYPH|nr:hypothetical protein GCM10010994_28700 [Chelatococcus reniformis]
MKNTEIDTFGLLADYQSIMDAIGALYTEDHGYQTVVLDSLDKAEPLVWAATCAANRWESIESPGFGKGYLAADPFWRELLDGLFALRRDRGMIVVLIGHSEIIRFDDPSTVSYSRYDIRLHKRALAMVQDEADAILFINQDVTIQTEEQGFNKKRSRGEGGHQRWIYTEGRPAFVAKNRFDMPPKILFDRAHAFDELAKHFPGMDAPASVSPSEAAA